MKLAEALTERKALQEKVARLRVRLTANARVQEGDAAAALEALIVRINRTNLAATLADEPRLTLMEAVARRDMLKLRFAALGELVNAAAPAGQRFFAVTRSEIKSRATVNVAELQGQLDALAREIRELDARLQAANWTVDLVE